MLTVTENAANALQAVMGGSELPGCGIRISKNELSSGLNHADAALEFRLDVVIETPAEDEVVTTPGGVHVFIEPEIVPLVEDSILDGSIDEVGKPAFFLKAE